VQIDAQFKVYVAYYRHILRIIDVTLQNSGRPLHEKGRPCGGPFRLKLGTFQLFGAGISHPVPATASSAPGVTVTAA
jgi:hypothetical protein